MQSLGPPAIVGEPNPADSTSPVTKLGDLLGERHPANEVLHPQIVWQGLITVGEVIHIEAQVGEAGGVAHLGVVPRVGLDGTWLRSWQSSGKRPVKGWGSGWALGKGTGERRGDNGGDG